MDRSRMFEGLRKQWRVFRADPAGERFQRRYRRNKARAGLVRKFAIIGGGLALVVIGIALLVLPGPGLLLMLLGAGLIAEESQVAARLLDRMDLAVQRFRARRAT
ncbi:MAG: PGPGW domain-containing protein [Rhodanobacteraceae bacterium]